MEDEKTYGKINAVDGEFDVIDFIMTETLEGRQWSLSLLSDGTIAVYLESIHEKTGERIKQSMRLTKKSIAILQICLSYADKQFNLEMEKTARNMLKDGELLKIKVPDEKREQQ